MEHGYKLVTPAEVAAMASGEGGEGPLLLDVRTLEEYQGYHIPGVVLIPIDVLNRRYQELDPDRATICICEHGVRSEAAAAFLARMDFVDVATMRGGMVQWTGPVERG